MKNEAASALPTVVADLLQRVATLEKKVQSLQDQLTKLASPPQGD